jgi:hydrogenase maturation protein HypF
VPLFNTIDNARFSLTKGMIAKEINCPLTSGAGRLFDAVAAITGICLNSLFHAEAPMRLESLVNKNVQDHYDFVAGDEISFLSSVQQLCSDLTKGITPDIISARFHNTLTEASLQMVRNISRETGIRKVVLSGGTFQNKYLFESLENKLLKDNFAVFSHSLVPCNDGGLALGQLAVAARRK